MLHLLGSTDPTVQERVGGWFGLSGATVVGLAICAVIVFLGWRMQHKD